MKFLTLCCTIVALLVSTSSHAALARKLRCQKLFEDATEVNPFGVIAQQHSKMEDVSNGVKVEIITKKIAPEDTMMDVELQTRIIVRDERTNKVSFEYDQPGASFVKALTPYSVLVGTMQGILVLAQYNPETKTVIRRIVLSPVTTGGTKDKLYPKRIFARNIKDGKFLIIAVLTNSRIVSIELNVDSYKRSDYIYANYID